MKLFNWYMELPMYKFVTTAVIAWTTLCSIFVSPAVIVYVVAWCAILSPFLLAIDHTEFQHRLKKEQKHMANICRKK